MSTVNVLIERENKYLNQFGKAALYKVGDTLTTSHTYAERIVASGSATFGVAPDVAAPDEDDTPEPTETLFTDVKGVTEAINARLLAADATWASIVDLPVSSLTKVPGLGPKTAALLKAQAQIEVERDAEIANN